MAANQKTLNMYYTLDEDSDLVNAYPDVDFEFIEFPPAITVSPLS